MIPLPASAAGDCWNTIGVRGDRTCQELTSVVHCQNCPVFAAAGRRFLDAPSPPGYLEEWTNRLAPPVEEAATDLESLLVFCLADEWLALPVRILVEVTTLKPVHRIPFRAGVLAGIVNIRGELYLCAHLAKLLGIDMKSASGGNGTMTDAARRSSSAARVMISPSDAVADGKVPAATNRLLVIRRDTERWVLPVDAVEKVVRVPRGEIGPPPATVGRSLSHLSRGVFHRDARPIGLLDDDRLFEALRAKLR